MVSLRDLLVAVLALWQHKNSWFCIFKLYVTAAAAITCTVTNHGVGYERFERFSMAVK